MQHRQYEQYLILANDDNDENVIGINQLANYNHQSIMGDQMNPTNFITSSLSYMQKSSSSTKKYRSNLKHFQTNINYNNNNNNINANQQLQDLLQSSDTVIYNNTSNLQSQKKRLQFITTDMSFFSKDCTQDYTSEEGYTQLVSKIHFQRSRNRQLINQLAKQKENIIQRYLQQIMDEFKQLSDQNKRLRQVYKKQAGGGYKLQKQQKMVRNNSAKIEQMRKNNSNNDLNYINNNNNHTPRNSTTRINSRKSISSMSVIAATQQPPLGYSSINNNMNNNNMKSVNGNKSSNRVFFGVGGGNFYQTQKLDTLRCPTVVDGSSNRSITSKMHTCESSINMHTVSNNTKTNTLQNHDNLIQPSPRVHKRRQSQLTQRKDYPLQNTIKNYNEQFLMMCDDQNQMSFYDNNSAFTNNDRRFSIQCNQQPQHQGKKNMMMMKNKQKLLKDNNNNNVLFINECEQLKTDSNQNFAIKGNNNNNNNNNKMYTNNKNITNASTQRIILNDSVQRASFKLSLLNQQQQQSLTNNQYIPTATNTKNIFLQFLQTLLIEQHIASDNLTQKIHHATREQQQDIIIPSYQNIRYIEQLQKQITNKNLKLRQLQQVINVYKSEIEQIVGTDVKMVNQLMVQLLEVKGRYMEMQEKVDNLCYLRGELEAKEKVKKGILERVKKQQQKENKQGQSTNINKNSQNKSIQGPSFPIPQSIQTLFQLLNINIPKQSKPIEYLNQIKKLPKNQDLFQAFDSKKRTQCNMKIKQVIDQIKQGRKKFNQVIKIYQARIVKLQEKIHKLKVQMMGNQANNNRQFQDKQKRLDK